MQFNQEGREMTAIAAYIDENGRGYMGGDAATCSGMGLRVKTASKIFKKEGPDGTEWLFGFSGLAAAGQAIRFALDVPSVQNESNEDLERLIFVEVCPLIREALRKNELLSTEKGVSGMDGLLLIVVKGNVFEVDQQFHVVSRVEKIDTIGTGSGEAFGSLMCSAITGYPRDPRERIEVALRAAEARTANVRGRHVVDPEHPYDILEIGP